MGEDWTKRADLARLSLMPFLPKRPLPYITALLLLIDPVISKWDSGVLFIGEKGMLLSDYGKHLLLPEAEFKDFTPPAPFIADSPGHHQEWLRAIREGTPTGSPFSYAGPLTEANHLGNVAFRSGTRLEWDAARMTCPNHPAADRSIVPGKRTAKFGYGRLWEMNPSNSNSTKPASVSAPRRVTPSMACCSIPFTAAAMPVGHHGGIAARSLAGLRCGVSVLPTLSLKRGVGRGSESSR